MEIQYSLYTLRPKAKANRLSSLEPRTGVYLRSSINGVYTFADYFPHAELGDSPADHFLADFKLQKDEYSKKILHFLKLDLSNPAKMNSSFRNHQLWSGSKEIVSPVVKMKILEKSTEQHLELLRKNIKIRLDGNGIFSRDELSAFAEKIPMDKISLIEYMEDPLLEHDWSNLPMPSGRDFITGSPYSYYIFKPNSRFYPETERPVIFSSYMGSDLGTWHAYCELALKGDLSLFHGIVVEDIYEDQKTIFKGNYHTQFHPDNIVIKTIYSDLGQREWKTLCSL